MNVDAAAMTFGETLTKGGEMAMAAGAGAMAVGGTTVVASGGAAVVAGGAVAVAGSQALAIGAQTATAGVMLMSNAGNNSSAGYEYGKEGKNGETSYTQKGRQAHTNYDPGPGYKKEQSLPSKKRVDAINRKEGIVKELKPNNPRAIKRGEKQVQQYVDELNRVDPLPNNRKWTGIVETYDR